MFFLSKLKPKVLPLSKYERKITQPFGIVEEGVIEEIFNRIKPQNKFCIEFGAGDGFNFSFTRNLIEKHGWNALLIEADDKLFENLINYYSKNKKVKTVKSMVTKENITAIFKNADVPNTPDFMLIDIDGNDYHLWKAIVSYSPKVVMIEYNASYGYINDFIMPYNPNHVWTGDDYCGASFNAMVKLGEEKGYVLVHTLDGGDNLVFVKKEFSNLFELPQKASAFYQIPQYGKNGRAINGKGHSVSKINTSLFYRFFCKTRYAFMGPVRSIAKILKSKGLLR